MTTTALGFSGDLEVARQGGGRGGRNGRLVGTESPAKALVYPY